MPLFAICLCLLLMLFAPVSTAQAAIGSRAPSLDYVELVPFLYSEKFENDPAGSFTREGEGAALKFGWQANELLAFRGSLRVTDSSPESSGADTRSDQVHGLAMAFVAPFSDSMRLLIELGLAGETVTFTSVGGQESETKSSSDVFAALDFRVRFNWFELGLRSAGQTFHNSRHKSHALDARFHVSDHFALGAYAEVDDRDARDTQRLGLSAQLKF